MPMPRDFADWYRAASISPPADLLEKRWLGVEGAANKVTSVELLTLLRLFCLDEEYEDTPEFLDEAFREHDPAFPHRDNRQELRVLAGAILRQLIDEEYSCADAAALGVVCCSHGLRSGIASPEQVDAAHAFIIKRGAELREIKSRPTASSSAFTQEQFDELMPAAVFNANQTPHARAPLFNTFNEQAKRFASSLNRQNAALWRIIQVQREELDILWWLQARLSRDLNAPFERLDSGPAALVFGAELADLTTFVPGPDSILGVLITSLGLTQKRHAEMSILSAVAACPREWRQRRTKNHSTSIEICPVMLAMAKSLETEGDGDWLPVFKRYSRVAIEKPVDSSILAHQLYHELLFERAITELAK